MGSALRVRHVAQERAPPGDLVRVLLPQLSVTAHVQRGATALVVPHPAIAMARALQDATVHAVVPRNIVMVLVGRVTFRIVLRRNAHNAHRAALQNITRSMHAMIARLASTNLSLVRPCVFRATVKRKHCRCFASMVSLVAAMALAVA